MFVLVLPIRMLMREVITSRVMTPYPGGGGGWGGLSQNTLNN